MFSSGIGLAIFEALYATFLTAQYTHVDPAALKVAEQYGALTNYLHIRNMPLEAQGPIVHAYMQALHRVFIIPFAVSGVGFVLVLFLRNVRYGESTVLAKNLEATQKVQQIV